MFWQHSASATCQLSRVRCGSKASVRNSWKNLDSRSPAEQAPIGKEAEKVTLYLPSSFRVPYARSYEKGVQIPATLICGRGGLLRLRDVADCLRDELRPTCSSGKTNC